MDDKQIEIDFMIAQGLAIDIAKMMDGRKMGIINQTLAITLAHFARVQGNAGISEVVGFVATRALEMAHRMVSNDAEPPMVN